MTKTQILNLLLLNVESIQALSVAISTGSNEKCFVIMIEAHRPNAIVFVIKFSNGLPRSTRPCPVQHFEPRVFLKRYADTDDVLMIRQPFHNVPRIGDLCFHVTGKNIHSRHIREPQTRHSVFAHISQGRYKYFIRRVRECPKEPSSEVKGLNERRNLAAVPIHRN